MGLRRPVALLLAAALLLLATPTLSFRVVRALACGRDCPALQCITLARAHAALPNQQHHEHRLGQLPHLDRPPTHPGDSVTRPKAAVQPWLAHLHPISALQRTHFFTPPHPLLPLQNNFDVATSASTKNFRSLLQETPSYGGEHGGSVWP